MGLQGFSDKLKGATEKAAEMGGAAHEKVDAVLEDFKKAKSTMEAFGFKVGKFKVDMGVLPEINTSIEGFVKDIQDDKINQLIEANKDKFLGHRFEFHDEIYNREKACVRYSAIKDNFNLEVSEWYYSKDGLIDKIIAYYNIEGEISNDRKLAKPK